MRPKLTLLLVLAGVLAGTLLLDHLIYDRAIFQPRNKSGWDAFRWYNFEYHGRLLKAKRSRENRAHSDKNAVRGKVDARKPFVLFLGSSVARYAYNRSALQTELERRADPVPDFNILTHASMVPMDAYFYVPRIRALRPDLVVYVMNPADLDLERYTPPWEAGPAYSETAAMNYMLIRRPLDMYYPGEFAWSRRESMGLQKRLRLHLRSAFASMRYKDDWFDPLYFNLRWSGAPLRRYLNYQGRPRGLGLWRDGVTGACFSLTRKEMLRYGPNKFKLQFRREVMGGGDFRLELFTYASGEKTTGQAKGTFAQRTQAKTPLTCREPSGARKAGTHAPGRHGWRKFSGPWSDAPREHDTLFIRLSHVEQDGKRIPVTADTPVQAGRGLRLPGNLGLLEPREQDYLFRRRTLKDEELLFLSESENARRFQAKIHPADWRKPHRIALRQLNYLRLAKYYVNWYEFSEIFQVRELGKFARRLTAESPSTRLLIINNAENPLTLDAYAKSEWYAGYLRHMQRLAAEMPGVDFLDLHDRGRARDFSDAHHLTYDGAHRLTPAYVRAILQILKTSP